MDYTAQYEELNEIKGEQHGKRYVLGQKVTVSVDDANLAARTIDFSIVEKVNL